MNRNDARKIAEKITNEQIKEMFDNAKNKITNWEKVSAVNKGITKGTAWNILAKNFNVNTKYYMLARTNFVREFGEFLSEELKIKKSKKSKPKYLPLHQYPVFD
jgi:hypothetical protein